MTAPREPWCDALRALRDEAEREPLEVDISDYGDEWCAGFLSGQVNALDVVIARSPEGPMSDAVMLPVTQYPTAIEGTWTDAERRARYLVATADSLSDEYQMAEAVLVLLGQPRPANSQSVPRP